MIYAVDAEVLPERHWMPPENYVFARDISAVRLGLSEVPAVSQGFPIWFFRTTDGFCGVLASLNAQPDVDGQFATFGGARFQLPALLRLHPFAPIRQRDGRWVFCVSDLGGCLRAQGVSFFDDEGDFSPEVQKVRAAIGAVIKDLERTHDAVSELHNALVLSPVSANFSEGLALFRTDEDKLVDAQLGHSAHMLAATQLNSQGFTYPQGENVIEQAGETELVSNNEEMDNGFLKAVIADLEQGI